MIRDKLKDWNERMIEWEQEKFDQIGSWADNINVVDRDESEIESIVEEAKGTSIRPNNLFNKLDKNETVPSDLLDAGEQPHYFLVGTSIDVEGDGAGTESITGWDRDRRIGESYTLITEQRVLVIANHVRGYDEHTIPYGSITAVNLNTGIMSNRLSLQTRGATYHLSVTNSDDDEIQEAVGYLRDRRRQEDTVQNTTGDPLDRLEKLKSLHDDGALTDEEFQEKKASLLDDI